MTDPTLRILLVDQNVTRASILEEGLREAGYTNVSVVRDMQNLLRRIVDADPDVIFIDLENPNRDVLEQIATEQIQIGIRVALANARGVHWRGEGGAQERELAAKYRGWADAMEFTHPRVAAIMRGLERSYLHQAEWEDNDARVARRIRS